MPDMTSWTFSRIALFPNHATCVATNERGNWNKGEGTGRNFANRVVRLLAPFSRNYGAREEIRSLDDNVCTILESVKTEEEQRSRGLCLNSGRLIAY